MRKYTFEPTQRLRLEVERDPRPGEYVNLIDNPSGELGAWAWITPLAGSAIVRTVDGGGAPFLRYLTVANQVNEFYAAPFKVIPGEQIRAQWEVTASGPPAYRARFRWYDLNGNPTAPSVSDDITVAGTTNHWTTARTVPAGTAFAALSLRPTAADFTDTYPTTGAIFAFRNVRVFSSAMGPLTDAAMLGNAGAPNVLWENVLGPSLEVNVRREEFDLGTLSATILDSTLDPAVASTLRPGRRVQLTALRGSASGSFVPLFTGSVDVANVSYDLRTRGTGDPKHARIELTAVDAMQTLSAMRRPHGVDTIPELPAVFEGASQVEGLSVPWDCDGSMDQNAGATWSSSNANATAADQVALTRDGSLGYAWIDPRGVVMARTTLPAAVDFTFDESAYSDLDLSFDTRRLINSVDVKTLIYDAGTDETTETEADTYMDPSSIQTWGKRSRTFTLTAGQLAVFADFPGTVFAANATPKIQPLSLTLPILHDPERAARAFIDLYDLVRVRNVDKGIDEQMRVTSLEHRISTDKWLVQVGFAGDTTVAIPQRQPTR